MNLVCIHGNSSDASVFDEINIPGVNKVVLTLPGHGGTELGKVSSFQDLVKHCYQQISHLDDIILLGSSLGGHIVHHLLQDLKPKAIITFGAPPLNLQTVMQAFVPLEESQILFKSEASPEASRALADKMLELRKDKIEFISRIFQNTAPQAREIIGGSLMRGEFLDEVELLKNYQGKKLLIIPSHERLVNQSYLRDIDYMDKIEVSGGHALSIDNPLGIQEAIKNLVLVNAV